MATREKERVEAQREVVVRGAAAEAAKPAEMTAEDLQAMLEAQLQSAYEEAMARRDELAPEVAEPFPMWNLYAIGPIQLGAGLWGTGAPPPYVPHQVIRVGEQALVATVLIVAFPLYQFGLPYEVTYGTGELKSWQLGPPDLQYVSNGNLNPTSPFVVDIFSFQPRTAGLYEMNICARIFGCQGDPTPPFSGFARLVQKIDPSLFFFEPTITYDTGVRFQVYP